MDEEKANEKNDITSPEEYQNLHLFPNVYPDIKADTAGMMIFEDRNVDVEAVKRVFSKFMVKDSVKSVKGTEFPAFFDSSVTQQEFRTAGSQLHAVRAPY